MLEPAAEFEVEVASEVASWASVVVVAVAVVAAQVVARQGAARRQPRGQAQP